MKGLFYSREWGGQNWYLRLYNDRSETWHVFFFFFFFSPIQEVLLTLSKDVFNLVKETPLEAVMIVQEMYVMVAIFA